MAYDPIARARQELKPYQSNIVAKLADGSELRAVWDTVAFRDFDDGVDFHAPVVDWWLDHKLPCGGFCAGAG